MKIFTRWLIIVCVFAVSLLVLPAASADEWSNKTVVTLSAPFEVPGVGAQVLPAGTYVFKLMDSPSNRHIVRILNEDETHVFTTILAIPNYRLRTTGETVMTFSERAQGEPQAIRAWFYPGHTWGEEFVYPKSKAIELAKTVHQPVLYTPAEITTVDDLKTAPVEAVMPTGVTVPVAEVVQAPPLVEVAQTLPQTASYLPLLGIIGLLSLGLAGAMSKYSA